MERNEEKEIHFCCRGVVTISDMKDDNDLSCWQKPGTDLNMNFLTVVMANISAKASWMTNSTAGLTKKPNYVGEKHSDNEHGSDSSMQIVNQQLRRSSSCFLRTLLLLHCLRKRPSAGCQFLPHSLYAFDLSLLCVRACVCVCHCNVCVGSPEWASHKQMGSWKATSHIVTEEIPFFCPQSWWHWWPCRTAPETTEQTRGRPPSLRPYTQMKQMSTAQDHSWKFVLGFVQQKAVPVKTVWLSRAVNPN